MRSNVGGIGQLHQVWRCPRPVGRIFQALRAAGANICWNQKGGSVKPPFRTTRAFGLPERRVVFKYALRISIIPTISIIAVGLGSILSSAVFVESVFTRPGIGTLITDEGLSDTNHKMLVEAGIRVIVARGNSELA